MNKIKQLLTSSPKFKKYFLVFLIFELLIIMLLTFPYFEEKQSYSMELTGKLQTVVEAVVNIYGLVSQTIYQEVINKPEIIDLFKHAYTANEAEQAVIRAKMQDKLQSTYHHLEEKNLRQLHFHLPDGTSFLRMHKPDKFGDNLFDIRYSIKLANTLKQPVQGFEEGRIFNGFRYVFPLFDGSTHIGSVETSISFEAVHKEIAKLYSLSYQLILEKDVVVSNVFSSEQSNYVPCIISDEYMCENDKLRKVQECYFCYTRMKEIDQALKNYLNSQLAQEQPFVSSTRVYGTNYVLIFYPVKNLHAQVVAYIVGYTKDEYFVELKEDLYLKLSSLSLLNLVVFLFIMHIQYNKELMHRKNQDLVRLNQDKNEFLGIAAHDLKNPLSAIQGLSEEIETNFDELSKEEIVEFAGLITSSSRRMFALISNLLDVSAIESGKFDFHFEHIDLLPILQHIIDTYQKAATVKHIQIHLDTTAKTCFAYVDRDTAYQILDNLISNAVKYSPWHRAIYISLQAEETFIRCVVKDEGPGLSHGDQQKLFNKFSRLSNQPTNNEHSTGLGLFIVKKLVEAIRAEVWCESEVGQGATFIVRFPQTQFK